MAEVAPFVGAWIEILRKVFNSCRTRSLRSSERGLKSYNEMIQQPAGSRSVRRSVD